MPRPKHDTFLADVINPRGHKNSIDYWDGFRFGLGLITAHLLVFVVVGALGWAIALLLHLG